jgi:hypothetical protein
VYPIVLFRAAEYEREAPGGQADQIRSPSARERNALSQQTRTLAGQRNPWRFRVV